VLGLSRAHALLAAFDSVVERVPHDVRERAPERRPSLAGGTHIGRLDVDRDACLAHASRELRRLGRESRQAPIEGVHRPKCDRLNQRLGMLTDTGNGIPEDIQSRVFDPFFTTKEVGKGTGQGLAIARASVNEHDGGQLTFETSTGHGTTFLIRLPLAGDVKTVA
jgi:nitrogen-specific signal transduction histidine kinase